ncbi:MAG TPA: DUF4395 domain-containing protein [Actinomycetota bacterium]|nr:DUF4395 domain-containing protein [Actinomycetota bacterium]
MAEPRVAMVDPRQPRFGQAITGLLLGVAYFLDWPAVIPVLAAILAGASLLGPRANLYAYLFRAVKRAARLGPPSELEEAAPPRFANTVGFGFLTVASVAYFAFSPPLLGGWLAWGLALVVSVLALLAATTGLCVGCELYVAARRVATRGRVAGKRVAPPSTVASGTG